MCKHRHTETFTNNYRVYTLVMLATYSYKNICDLLSVCTHLSSPWFLQFYMGNATNFEVPQESSKAPCVCWAQSTGSFPWMTESIWKKFLFFEKYLWYSFVVRLYTDVKIVYFYCCFRSLYLWCTSRMKLMRSLFWFYFQISFMLINEFKFL